MNLLTPYIQRLVDVNKLIGIYKKSISIRTLNVTDYERHLSHLDYCAF